MKLHPRLTRATLELVTRFESFQAEASPAGVGLWTIGYGHTRSAREGAHITRSDAEMLLLYDLSAAAEEVDSALFAPISQREFEALTAFCFNIGPESFRRSTALARMNAGAPLEAADEIERWRHAELGAGQQVVDALVRRRAAEKAHFLGLPAGFAKSPSALVRPLPGDGGEVEAVEPPPMEALPIEPAPSEGPPIEPAPTESHGDASATRDAANSVQARLRQLIPDGGPAAEAFLSEPTPPHARDEADDEAHDEAAPSAEEPFAEEPSAPMSARTAFAAPANDAAPEAALLPPPPPPPPPPPAPADEQASAPEEPTAALRKAGPFENLVPEPPARPAFRITLRHLHLALIALGACLLALAVVLILSGRPSLANLGLGVLGAVVMTPGVYGVLGPRPSAP